MKRQEDNKGLRCHGWKSLLATSLGTVALCLLGSPLCAHGLIALARFEDDAVRIECFFSDDAPARGARVTVREHTGPADGGSSGGRKTAAEESRAVFRGTTDEQGFFAFAPTRLAELTVTVEDSYGHTTRLEIPAARLRHLFEQKTVGAPESAPSEEPENVVATSRDRGLLGGLPEWIGIVAGLLGIALLTLLISALTRRRRGGDAP